MSKHRSRDQIIARLRHWKGNLKARSNLDALERLIAGYEKYKARITKTANLELLQSTSCPARFFYDGSYYCGNYIPRTKRKLLTLQECAICISKKGKAKAHPVTQEAITGKVEGSKITITRSAQAYEEYTQKQTKVYCKKLGKDLNIPALPCVKALPSLEASRHAYSNCHEIDCERRIRNIIEKVYLQ